MTDALQHRGPDGVGYYSRQGIAFGHRRLSIIDLSPSGAQPMTLGADGPTVSYNGELYNFQALREELVRAGRTFRGRSDTEVLLQAYDTWGLDGLKRLEGIFAFALWDPMQRRLVLMRDRLGVKPLFYSRVGSRLLFSSEITSLKASGAIDSFVDDQALAEFLWYGNAFEERTIYRNVRAVQAGYWMIIDDAGVCSEPWWRLEDWITPDDRPTTEHDAVARLRQALPAAVSRQLVADVPVGIFLSGGLDSSTIAYTAARDAGQLLRSFSAGFDFERGVDELPSARRVAAFLGLDHHELRVTTTDLGDVLFALARAHGEPFADAANVPLYLMSRALRGEIKVVLQGDGGDEMFAGYRRSLLLQHAGRWRQWPRWASAILRAFPGELARRAARMGDAMSTSAAMRMALLLTIETVAEPPTTFLTAEARDHLDSTTDPFLAFKRCDERFGEHEPVQRMLLTDLVLQLPSQFLAKVDRATMANGIEARVPLLDERIGELSVGLDSSWKVRRGTGKVILREAMRGRLPDDVLDAPKTGFGVPYQAWLRGGLHEFARDVLLDEAACIRFGVDRARMARALAEHRAGARDHGFVLWKYLQLALWAMATA